MADKTLLGFIASACKKITEQFEQEDNDRGVELATTADVQRMIKEAVTPTFIQSLSAEKKEPGMLDCPCHDTFMANGTPITITARADGKEGATIVWETGSLDVEKNINIFGGCHDDDTEVNSSITMTGGQINNLFGGGFHKSHTVLAEVVVKGGTVKGCICGGGASSFDHDCGCENGTTWFAGDGKDSPCVTDEARVTVYGGTAAIVYGGGEGISCTKKTSVVIDSDDSSFDYVSVSGSNGYTGEGSVTIKKVDTVKTVQALNRGHVDSATITVQGGKNILALYACAETPLEGNTATIDKSVVKYKKAAYIVKKLLGGNNGVDLDALDESDEQRNVVYMAEY